MRAEGQSGAPGTLHGDPDGLFMANPAAAAGHVARRLAGRTVLELCCGIGATTVHLAAACRHVYAVDVHPQRLAHARRNLEARGLLERVTLLVGDALAPALLARCRADAAYADPDWSPAGSPKWVHAADPAAMQPPADRLLELVTRHVTRDVVLRLPAAVPVSVPARWGPCEVESLAIGGRAVGFRHVYFGGLARTAGETHVTL